MSDIGWIKLHRNLRNSFSNDKKLNIQLWMLYVYLAEQAAWDDFGDLKRGQVKIKAIDIQNEIFPNMYLKRIRHLIAVLRKLGHIKTSAADPDNKEGLIFEVCQYDCFSGELSQKQVRQSLDSASTVVRQSKKDKDTESLNNNHVILTALDSASTVVRQPLEGRQCSSYIEERIKEEKEEKEELIGCNLSSKDDPPAHSKSLSIINDEPKKLKRTPRVKKDVDDKIDSQPVKTAYYEAYRERYGVTPVMNGLLGANAKRLIIRLESTEKAVAIVKFYLSHNNRFYLQNAHAFKFCLSDCEKLHTEYMKQGYIFSKDTKKVEDATANSILLEQLLQRNRKERDDE